MTNPASPSEVNRTCPNCKRQVKPGNKSCEYCGTQMPSLLTCSKCGTRFIHSTTKCDLCGAPLIPEEVPKPDADGTKGPDREEMPEPDEGKIPEPAEERKIIRLARKVIRFTQQIQEPDTDETKGPDEEDVPEPAEERKVIRFTKQIREPDTDETREPDEEEVPEPAEERKVIRFTKQIREPDTGEIREPDVDEAQEPDGEELPEPDVDETREPDVDETREPDVDETREPDVDETREPDVDETREPDVDETREPDVDETREPDVDETREPDEEEVPEPAEERKPRRYSKEIREPDTAELLAKYGDDYEDEKPVTGWRSWFRGREAPANVDEALFLVDEKPKPAKPPKNRMRIVGAGMMLAAVLIAVFFFGLPVLTGIFNAPGSPAAEEITPGAEQTLATTPPTPTVTPNTASGPLVTRPTQLVPIDQKYYFQVQKNPITLRISVIYIGSSGEGGITRADIKVSHADGSVSTGVILPLKGITEISLNGSDETDRVEIIATLSSGETYRVYDNLFPSVGRI